MRVSRYQEKVATTSIEMGIECCKSFEIELNSPSGAKIKCNHDCDTDILSTIKFFNSFSHIARINRPSLSTLYDVRESDVRCRMMKSGDPGYLGLISSGSPSKWFTSPSLP